ncbi:MAG TPA: helix-turn-helix domain-containing protein [Candidatus Paceibacterota bacterium]
MDDKLLVALGLHAREAKVYRAVVKAGEIAPAPLAKATGIKRTSAYAIARGLVEKGLLVEDSTKRPRMFLPASPKEIEHIVSEERKRLDTREKLFKQLASDLSQAQSEKTYPVPQIRFVEEDKIERFLYSETPKWIETILNADGTWWGSQDHTFVEHYRKWIDWQWKQEPDLQSVKLLTNKSVPELRIKGRYPKRSVKFWNKAANFVSTTWIAGEYLIMVNTRQRPFYLVEIHDATLANDQREVFKNLWPLV